MGRFDSEGAAALYREGVSASEIGRRLGVGTTTVVRALRRCGVPLRSHGSALDLAHQRDPTARSRSGRPRVYACNQAFFDTLTPASSYVVGFIQADGTVLPDRFSITTSVKDAEFLHRLAAVMGTDRPPMHVRHALGEVVRLQVNSRRMASALMTYGIHSPRTETASTVPSLRFDRDYWRGVVDGDGCLHVDKRGRRVLQVVGALSLCEQFRDFVKASGARGRASVRPCTGSPRVYRVQLNGGDARLICRVLYDGAEVFLPRKKNLYEEYFA